jgi:membrane protein involved in colicin uptake
LFGGGAVDFTVEVPGRARKSRERIVTADSVNFRRAGRKAATTPYAGLGTSGAAAASSSRTPAAAIQDNDDSNDDADDFFDYIDVDSSSSSKGVEGSWHSKVPA